ncbi:CHAP domain-containing protein [Anaerovorax odorimutans]|uniref:CHAP domain-containing protein n=1 Tax=Anaerovorax odorimutans TaxID=109327 RepID=A0ABT1RQU3_9FIRM|nr:CHAP domain-containing protein [Anaerovorax odorimutans]MCQ4637563.1 CHAP domain-containing protein [Anaerovorax odorimutans]
MKQKLVAGILLILTIFIFCGRVASQGAGQQTAMRTEPPMKGHRGTKFYYSREINPFYPELAPYHRTRGGYVTGNCTWYAWGRVCEMRGSKLEHVFTGDAGTWFEQNKKESCYPYGQEPKKGAILCYKTHVAVVEDTDPLTVSESGWKIENKKSRIVFHCGEPWRKEEKPLGYIYVTEDD